MAFPMFNKRPEDVLTAAEKEQIVTAIRQAESRTSGEIRVYMESHNKYVDPVDRAAEIFYSLKMEQTAERNAVLLYVALKDRQMAIFGDEGIYGKTGKDYWNSRVAEILRHFNKKNFAAGISEYVQKIGEGLQHYFPYNRETDHNELPDDIAFGN
ncbi:MAG TPA: TPM domain-containing protein [Niabella sp.]